MKRLLFVVLLIAGAVLVPIGPVQAAACSGTAGVTVVVQFRNGPVQVGCAPGDPSSGYQALRDAGFAITQVQGQNGAICQINLQPADKNSCWGSTYWSYWHAKPGHSWGYANSGASYNPAPGSFEGWHFTDDSSSPDYSVPAPPTPTTKPTPHPTSHPTAGASNPVDKPLATGRATPGSTSTAPDATSTASGTPTVVATATEDGTPSSDPTPTLAASGEPRRDDPGTTEPSGGHSWIWGVALVGVLGAAAVTTAVRRRRS